MRALKPVLGQILAVLLLMQWGGGLPACLARMAWDPAQTLCHAAAPEDTENHGPEAASTASCPVCAPLPPAVLPPQPVLPHPAVAAHGPRAAPIPPSPAAPAPRPGPQQPRAPPAFS